MAQIIRTGIPVSRRVLAPLTGALGLLTASLLSPLNGWAGPVQCTTSLEAPILPTPSTRAGLPPAPVEVTRCAPVVTVPELVDRRSYTYSPPFQEGVNISHQIQGALGVSLARDGSGKILAFGFPEQLLIWDASAMSNTTAALMDDQVNAMPTRTHDLTSAYNSSLAFDGLAASNASARRSTIPTSSLYSNNVRGLW